MSSQAKGRGAAHEPDSAAIEVRNLVAGYGDHRVVDDLSFDVASGKTLVLLGPSGCGKSTLLRTLVGLHPIDAGAVRLLGQDTSRLNRRERMRLFRNIGMAFQGSALLGSLTVGENVSLALREHTKLDQNTIRIMTRIKLELVGLGGADDKLPSELSGGMRKRAGIARALAMDPKILFLDEPSAGLDPVTSAGLDELLLKLQRALSLTLVVVTHELDSARLLANHIIVLDRGKIRAEGSVEDMDASKDSMVRSLFDRRPASPDEDSEGLIDELTR